MDCITFCLCFLLTRLVNIWNSSFDIDGRRCRYIEQLGRGDREGWEVDMTFIWPWVESSIKQFACWEMGTFC